LDPFIRGEDPVCDKKLPQTCQVGDLSGKHGTITSDPFEVTYHEQFASTLEGIGAYFGNRSFVVHFPNKTRITCANFDKVADVGPGDFTTPSCDGPTTSTGTVSITSTGTTVVTGASTTFTSTYVTVAASNQTTTFSTGAPTSTGLHVTTAAASGTQRSLVSLFGAATLVTAVMFML
jgi:hypothetical protein